MDTQLARITTLRADLALLRQALDDISSASQRLGQIESLLVLDRSPVKAGTPPMPPAALAVTPDDDADDNIYVFAEDDAEAHAFDEFYRAYDETHETRRRFLFGHGRRRQR